MRIWLFSGRQILWWVLSCLTLGVFLGTKTVDVLPVAGTNARNVISGKVIVVDAGHGGIDPGAVSASGILEKEITLKIAKELEVLLEDAAVDVIMVRHNDCDLADSSETNVLNRKRQDLKRRVLIAEEAGADLFISIHANYFPAPVWSGAQTFYDEGNPLDQYLAETIQGELVRRLGPNTRLAKAGDFRVLRDTTMPAALVEVGFLSNPAEAQRLSQTSYQKEVAAAIFAGLLLYYSE